MLHLVYDNDSVGGNDTPFRLGGTAADSNGKPLATGYEVYSAAQSRLLYSQQSASGAALFEKKTDPSSFSEQRLIGSEITTDLDGNSYVVGFNRVSPRWFGYAASFDGNANALWQVKLKKTPTNDIHTKFVAAAYNNGLFVGGTLSDTTFDNFKGLVCKINGGALDWAATFNGLVTSGSYVEIKSVAANDNNVFVLGRYAAGTGTSTIRYWVAKLDHSGNLAWQKQIDVAAGPFPNTDSTDARGASITCDSSGNSYSVTQTASNTVLLTKLSASGIVQWQQEIYGESGNSLSVRYGSGVVLSRSNKIYLTLTELAGLGTLSRPILMKYSSDGELVWQRKVTSSQAMEAMDVSLLDSQTVLLASRNSGIGGTLAFLMAYPTNGIKLGTVALSGSSWTVSESALTTVTAGYSTSATSFTYGGYDNLTTEGLSYAVTANSPTFSVNTF